MEGMYYHLQGSKFETAKDSRICLWPITL